MSMFYGDIDAFPTELKMLISLVSSDNPEDYYEIEMDRDTSKLASFLAQVRACQDKDTPCRNYKQFASNVINSNVGSFYTNQDNISDLLSQYCSEFTPKQSFPGGDSNGFEGDKYSVSDNSSNMDIKESIVIKQDTMINNRIIPKGKRIEFFYKGRI